MSADATPARPPALVATLVIAAAEVLLLLGVGAYVVFLVVSGRQPLLEVTPLAVLPLVLGAGLALAARGLARGQRWARAPVVTWQLFQAVLLQPALGQGGPLRTAAIVAFAASVVVVVSLFTPAVVRATSGSRVPPAT